LIPAGSVVRANNGKLVLFRFNALFIASNGTHSRVGALTANWERFFEHVFESYPERDAGVYAAAV
jgi:type I site-specific restriction-modification system R (restriction) subunit